MASPIEADRLMVFRNAEAPRAGRSGARRVCRNVVGQMTVFLIGVVRRADLNAVQTAGQNEGWNFDPNEAGLTMIFRIVVVPTTYRNAVVLMMVYPIAEAPMAGLNEAQRIGLNAEVRRTYLNEAQRADPSEVPKDVRRSSVLHANRAGRQIWNHANLETVNPSAVKEALTQRADPPAVPNYWVSGRIAYRVRCLFGYPGGRQIWNF